MKNTVTLPRLFVGEMLGGLEPQTWEALSVADKLAARLSFIEARAQTLAGLEYDPANGLPVGVHVEAARLAAKAGDALAALAADDALTAAWLAVELGRNLERISTLLAVSRALDLTEAIKAPKSAGGQATAERKKREAQENIQRAVKLWAELEQAGRPEHERASVIAARMEAKTDTVRRWLIKAGLR
jgi:hypothetical protein